MGDRKTGRRVEYARERLFTLGEIASILKKSGYSIGHMEFTQFTVFFANRFKVFSKIIKRLEKWLGKRKLSGLLAINYRIEGIGV